MDPMETEFTTRRPTVTRTVTGLALFGPIGALIGFASRKKERQRVVISPVSNDPIDLELARIKRDLGR